MAVKMGWDSVVPLCVQLLLLLSLSRLGSAELICYYDRDLIRETQIECTGVTDDLELLDLPTYLNPRRVKTLLILDSPRLMLSADSFGGLIFQHLQEIHIINSSVTPGSMKHIPRLKALKRVILDNNNITQLTSDCFNGWKHIGNITLINNNLRSIAEDVFQKVSALTYLDLTNNNITALPKGIFHALRKLKYLSLRKNALVDLDPKCFKELTRLRRICLDYNLIKEIKVDTFKYMPDLREVYIGGNMPKGIDPKLFDNNKKMKFLDLSDTDLSDLGKYPLNIPSLNTLIIRNCTITYLKKGFLVKLKELNKLFLSHNAIEAIELGTIKQLPKIKYVNLSWNRMQSMPLQFFKEIEPMIRKDTNREAGIQMTGNPWNCSTADMKEIRVYCQERGILFEVIFKCDSQNKFRPLESFLDLMSSFIVGLYDDFDGTGDQSPVVKPNGKDGDIDDFEWPFEEPDETSTTSNGEEITTQKPETKPGAPTTTTNAPTTIRQDGKETTTQRPETKPGAPNTTTNAPTTIRQDGKETTTQKPETKPGAPITTTNAPTTTGQDGQTRWPVITPKPRPPPSETQRPTLSPDATTKSPVSPPGGSTTAPGKVSPGPQVTDDNLETAIDKILESILKLEKNIYGGESGVGSTTDTCPRDDNVACINCLLKFVKLIKLFAPVMWTAWAGMSNSDQRSCQVRKARQHHKELIFG